MKKDSFEKKLAAYLAMSAAFLAAQKESNAQVMYTDVNPDLDVYNSFFNLDLNNDGVVDFKLQFDDPITFAVGTSCTVTEAYSKEVIPFGNNKIMGDATGYPTPFNLLDQIGSSAQIATNDVLRKVVGGYCVHYVGSSSSSTTSFYNSYGNFIGIDKIVGLSIESAGNTYYGWVRLNVGSYEMIIKDYAVNLTPDSSIVAGDNNGCSNGNLSVSPDPASGNENWICENDSLLIIVNGGVGYSFEWNYNNQILSGATDSSIYVSNEGTYGVKVFDSGCYTLFNSIIVDTISHYPLFGFGATYPTCYNSDGSITVNTQGGPSFNSFVWSNGETTETINNLAAGIYTVTVTGCNGVADSGSVNLHYLSNPQLGEYHTNACNNQANGSVYLTITYGQQPYHFLWSNGSTVSTPNSLLPGAYTVTLTDGNNCMDSLTVNILDNTPVLSAIGDTICTANAGQIDLTVISNSGSYSYLWNNGATTQDLTGLNPGIYTVTVTVAWNCTGTLSVPVVYSIPMPVITISNQILYSSYSGKNQWFLNTLSNPLLGDTLNYLTPPSNGYYWTKAIYPDGCINISDSVYVGFVTGIENTELPFISIEIINKKLLFHLADNSLIGAQIDIVNELGQLAASVTVTNQALSADLSALPSGIYFYHIRSRQKTYSGKFMIE